MKTLLKLEQLAILIMAFLLTLYLGYQWWLFFALLLLPDISMLGYIVNNKIGAFLYNLFHHQGVALFLIAFGYLLLDPKISLAGVILWGHSAMDRLFGYGLKYNKGFKYTHLGEIGSERKSEN
ncbi:DUF4260 domain-containing protein [Pseudopedobacter beijingensis]|uniref:DUF4260 domain-containing protein n=1 Tax=Pseudopedobacter beijingensis TaxID=1207056 RepID=A0ABW4I9G2_9SPHI